LDEHTERKHARFSPSQADRFFVCKGSANLLARVPVERRESEYAIEGTKAHAVLDVALQYRVRSAKIAHEDYSIYCCEVLDKDENFFYGSIQTALNYVYGILDEYEDAVMYNERKVRPPIDCAPGEADGFCDICIHIPRLRTVYIIDYKHGAGITKEVKDSRQCLQYASGFLYGPDTPINKDEIDKVIIVIVQPRAFHKDGAVREWETTTWKVWEYLISLENAIYDALQSDAPLVPDDNGKTTDHCRFCPANFFCPTRETRAVQVINEQFRTVRDLSTAGLPDPRTLEVERLAYIRNAAPVLRSFLDDVDDYVKEILHSGQPVPGSKLVLAQARREWYGEPSEIARQLSELAAVPYDDVWKVELIGITQAEKLVVDAYKARVKRGEKEKAAAEARKAMAYLTLKQSSGNLVLVYDDDERPAVNRAQTNFAQIDGEVIEAPTQDTDK
jgi:hypothetical protein